MKKKKKIESIMNMFNKMKKRMMRLVSPPFIPITVLRHYNV